ncbi:MAG: energy-coupling factor ABC transporter permease [Elusimicrobia bacterium]|jgi:cobalt/nickel transport system permease protein|nr:energy-coupling factor ABC transporter permease [Elusimicrobiota bacterium]
MHISDGIVPVPLAAAAWGVALVSVARGLRFLTLERVPRAALVSAVVFIAAATVRFPLGVASLHPVLNGLAGILLGPAVLPAYFVGLLLQALLLQFGGVTSLGLNTLILAFPAVGAGYVFRVLRRQFPSKKNLFWSAAIVGVLAPLFSSALWAGTLFFSEKSFAPLASLGMVPHILLALIEGGVAGTVADYLGRFRPEFISSSEEGLGSSAGPLD